MDEITISISLNIKIHCQIIVQANQLIALNCLQPLLLLLHNRHCCQENLTNQQFIHMIQSYQFQNPIHANPNMMLLLQYDKRSSFLKLAYLFSPSIFHSWNSDLELVPLCLVAFQSTSLEIYTYM